MANLRVDTIAGLGQTFGPNFNGDLEFNSQNFIVLPKGSSNQQGVLRTTEDVIGVGGTHYDNLVLALPLNEATQFKDVSSRGRNPGTYGNVSISSTISKYYGSSAKFDGTSDYFTIGVGTTDTDFQFGTGEFTIELWAYFNNTDNNMCLYDSRPLTTNGLYPSIQFDSLNNAIRWYINGAAAISESNSITAQTWHHIAVSRSGSSTRMFVDGQQIGGTYSDTNYYLNGPTDRPIVGVLGYILSSYNFNGHLQDFRIYKGLAKYTANFTPPERIAEIGVGFKSGALRYNTDSNLPELYDGNQWVELQVSSPNLGRGVDTEPGPRGLTGGGDTDSIEYINITSTGSIANFGTLAASSQIISSFGSSTRGYWAGGREGPTKVDRIQKVTFASLGDTTDFGDLKNGGRDYPAGCSNSTRGLIAGGYNPAETSNVEYVTMTSTGAGQDFGTLSSGTVVGAGAVSSPTRAIVFGKAGVSVNTIEFFTITTLGNSQDFGDTTDFAAGSSANTNGTRAVLALGNNAANINTLNYVTMTTTGNATNFGDLTVARRYSASMSSPIRGVFAGGYTNPEGALNINTIDYIEYAIEGNAVDFGDLTTTRGGCAGCSNAHGGL